MQQINECRAAAGGCIALSPAQEQSVRSCLPPNGAVKSIADFYAVFSDSSRIKIISALAVSELCVWDLCTVLNMNQTTVSHQLKLLRDARIVGCRRDGKIIYYRVVNPYVNEVMLTGVNHLNMVNGRYE